VRPDLKKYWVYRFSFDGKRFDTSLGSFPEITLAEARNKVIKLKGKILNGENPLEGKKLRAANQTPPITFDNYAEQYINRMSPKWRNAKHLSQWVGTIKTYAFPVIGKLPLEAITTSHIVQILEPIWIAKPETARRLMGRLERIISGAITSGLRASSNPALWRGHLENLLPRIPQVVSHYAAMPFVEVPSFMSYLEGKVSTSSLALQFVILNALRTGEVIDAKRTEVSGNLLSIPADRMKAGKMHEVPLCRRSVELIEQAMLRDPESKYLFSNNGRPLSRMAMLMLLRKYKDGLTVHGFRSSFRDWVSEATDHSPEVAEMALAHTISNKVEAAYRRGKLLDRRRILMSDWENFCLSAEQNLELDSQDDLSQ
jgi:integrase